jgi:hypothetical protein
VTGGAIGVVLYEYWPNTWACAERRGLILEPHSRLSVRMACGRRRSLGKLGSVLQRPARKWFLKVRMARLAEFARRIPERRVGSRCAVR